MGLCQTPKHYSTLNWSKELMSQTRSVLHDLGNHFFMVFRYVCFDLQCLLSGSVSFISSERLWRKSKQEYSQIARRPSTNKT